MYYGALGFLHGRKQPGYEKIEAV